MRHRDMFAFVIPFLAALALANTAAAYYSPRLGRFISRDPIGEDGGDSLYSYALNTPTNASEPVGRTLWMVSTSPTVLWKDGWDGPAQPVPEQGDWGTCKDCRAACEAEKGDVYGVTKCEDGSPCYCVCGSHIRIGQSSTGVGGRVHEGGKAANDLVSECVRSHELVHVGATRCDGNVARPDEPGRNEECEADLKSARCVTDGMARCEEDKLGISGDRKEDRKRRHDEMCRCYKRLAEFVRTKASGHKDKPEDPDCPEDCGKKCQVEREKIYALIRARGCK